MTETFGERLQRYRTKAGKTLEGLASDVGSTKSYIWELENKPNIRPSADLVYRIANKLGTTVGVLIGEDEPDDVVPKEMPKEDRVFFRHYQELKPQTKKQLSEIMEVLKKERDAGS